MQFSVSWDFPGLSGIRLKNACKFREYTYSPSETGIRNNHYFFQGIYTYSLIMHIDCNIYIYIYIYQYNSKASQNSEDVNSPMYKYCILMLA